ncbi:TPA: hypothetical protein ACGO1T_001760 [Streptococcus suis]
MEIRLNPFEIDTIESNTPICVTMEDGSKYIAYQSKFENKTVYQTRDSIAHVVEVKDNDTNKGDKQLYDWLKNHEDTSDILDKAWLDRFIVSEDEPLYYALIKGHELSSNELKYWSCNAYNSGDLLIGSKNPKDSCINRMTKNNWNKLGINSSNAEFVEVI